MQKEEFKRYITKKYKCVNAEIGQYIKLDMMNEFLHIIEPKEHLFFKGAANLFFNYSYKRENLTKDLDFSTNSKMKEVVEKIKKMFIFDTTHYNYKFVSYKESTIITGWYNGITINIQSKVKGLNVNDSFNIDIAVEELPNDKYNSLNGLKSYTIERTLADKYLSMIYHGKSNTREKDFIDLKNLYKECNFKELISISKRLKAARKLEIEKISTFKRECHTYQYIKKYKLNEIIKSLNEEIFN